MKRLSSRFLAVLAALVLPGGCMSIRAVPPRPDLPPMRAERLRGKASFDAASASEIESAWGEAFVLVHPRVNGRDVGWFVFDSGASGCTISAQAARRAGLTAVGTTNIAGLQGTEPTTVYQCDELRLGPLALRDIGMSGLNINNARWAFGREVAGFCGRDICRSAVIELDAQARRMRLFDPARPVDEAAGLPTGGTGVQWSPITMYRGLPGVRCRYGRGAEGLFVLDTGSDGSVHLFGSAVERHDLLNAGAKITGARTLLNYTSTRRVREGSMDYFSVDHHAVGPISGATFGDPGDGSSVLLPDADGTIGMMLLRRFVLLLDEPHGRMALLERTPVGEPSQAAAAAHQ